jgi:1-aminocyclopropane-1-carboxylate deaminase/D-cysteine desulfhydrase-like pyridoxal-dependent ACC family enzyme
MKKRNKGILIMALNIVTATQTEPLLFEAYPTLSKSIAHIQLGNLSDTPIIATTIGKAYKTNLYIKNDGIYGHDKKGNIIFAGNKRRKLEFLLADAQAHRAQRIYALGGAGSNFATCTAAYAHELGLACTLVLGPQRNTRYVQRNLKLDLFYGADIIAIQTREERTRTFESLANSDPKGYFIPLGGSNKIGALGYVNAAFELKKQIQDNVLPYPDVIYITVSSAGMAAGLVIGLYAAALDIPVRMVRIDGTPESISQDVTTLIHETREYLTNHDKTFPVAVNYAERFSIVQDLAGEEYVACDYVLHSRNQDLQLQTYALITPETQQAIRTLYNKTGIKLDGTYTGKAFAACLRDINTGKHVGKNVLFWDSFCAGSLNEYTQTVDISKLPEELQKYMDETYPLQDLDQGV